MKRNKKASEKYLIEIREGYFQRITQNRRREFQSVTSIVAT